jgi:hypothetical protein
MEMYQGMVKPDHGWLKRNQLEELTRNYPADWLWIGWERSPFPPLRDDIQRIWKFQRGTTSGPWRLVVALHEIKQVLDVPVGELMEHSHERVISPGVRLSLKPFYTEGSILRGELRLSRQWPNLGPPQDDEPRRLLDGSTMNTPCIVVITYPSRKEAQCMVEDDQRIGSSPDIPSAWMNAEDVNTDLVVPLPILRMKVGGLKLGDWMNEAHLQLWIPFARGTMEWEVKGEELMK